MNTLVRGEGFYYDINRYCGLYELFSDLDDF